MHAGWKRFRINAGATAREASALAVAPEPSGLWLSTAEANAEKGQVVLAFSGALDTGAAQDAARYSVEMDGQLVAIEGASCVGSKVILSLPASTWAARSAMLVSWSGLRDARGRFLADGQATTTAAE